MAGLAGVLCALGIWGMYLLSRKKLRTKANYGLYVL